LDMTGSKVALEIDQLTEQERTKLVQECQKEIDETESILSNANGIGVQTIMKKQTLVVALAERYEKLYDLGASMIPTNEIANFLLKRFQEMKVEIHKSTIYDNLPARFKTHTPNPMLEEKDTQSEDPTKNSSLNIVPEKENEHWIRVLTNEIDFLRSFRNKLSNSHFVSLLPTEIRKQSTETLNNIETIIRIANAIFDDRQSVPIELQHLLAAAFVTQTNNDAAGIYITHVKDFGANRSKDAREKLSKLANTLEKIEKVDTLTSKQAVKILLGHVTKVAEIYDPKTRNEALLCGYHGTQCTNVECRSWRTFLDFDASELGCRCYACDETFERSVASKCKNCYLPFYDEVIRVMKEGAETIENAVVKTHCPKCSIDVFLPIKKMMPILVKK
ncbi:MAG: hypothetical protein WA799_08905, partial [Nitrosotalea sp.]